MAAIAQDIAPHLAPGVTVTDVGSVKQVVIDAVGPHMPDHAHFIPGHPLAGTEQSGPRAGFAELFDNRWTILTPPQGGADSGAVARLTRLWQGMGAQVDVMDPPHHDLVLAVTSHTPHLIAYTMVGVADDLRRVTDSEVIKYSAAGFRDFTRIAASDPTMWRDVFLTNKDATLEILGRFTEELFALQRAIRRGDGDHLHAYFTHTRAIRRGIIDAGSGHRRPRFRTHQTIRIAMRQRLPLAAPRCRLFGGGVRGRMNGGVGRLRAVIPSAVARAHGAAGTCVGVVGLQGSDRLTLLTGCASRSPCRSRM